MSHGRAVLAARAELRAGVGALLRIAVDLEGDLRALEAALGEDGQSALAERIDDACLVLRLSGPGATTRRSRTLWNAQAKLVDAANAVRGGEPAKVVRSLLGQAEAIARELAAEMNEARERGESRKPAFLLAVDGVRVAADMIARCTATTNRLELVPAGRDALAKVLPLSKGAK